MRVLEVVAHAFGPFRDQRFEFAPGFTLVHGANEAGKSSLHAALYVGLCGIRRGKGRSTAEQEFERRHRPWQGPGWKVSVVLELADGTRVEMIQDLDDKAQCRALDAQMGRDLTSQVENDGTPDASLWLGLDRNTFLATACVRQAQLLAVRDDPAALQEHLQRAIDTSGTDATAAEALEKLDAFQKERVGGKQANSTRPLRRAMTRVTEAGQGLERARHDHAEYLALLAREDEVTGGLGRAHRGLALARAAHALAEVGRRRGAYERAVDLQRRHPHGAPSGLVADDDLAGAVERALQAYATRPTPGMLGGPSAAELRREFESLPREPFRPPVPRPEPEARAGSRDVPPAGEPPRREVAAVALRVPASAVETAAPLAGASGGFELQPAPELLEAVARLRGARRQVEEHAHEGPGDPGAPPGGGLAPAELVRLAAILAQPEPLYDPRLETRRLALEARLAASRRGARVLVGVAAGVAAAGAAVAIAGAFGHGSMVVGFGMLVAAAALALVSMRRSGGAPQFAMLEGLRQVETQLTAAHVRHDDWLAARDEAVRTVRTRGLALDPRALHDASVACEAWDRARARLAAWSEAHDRLRRGAVASEVELRQLLDARGVPASADVLADVEVYRRGCAMRARTRELELKIAPREHEEAARDRALAQREAAEAQLRDAARRCGILGADLETCRAGLETWRDDRRHGLAALEQARREWDDLARLLDGRTLEAVERELQEAEAGASALAAGFAAQEILATAGDETERVRRAARVREAELALERLRGEITHYAQTAPRVADAEEELAAAQRELAQIQRLDATLQTAREFLMRAQERVHRDVAPRLAEAIRPRLGAVTSGRYDDARVDPESLAVWVRDGDGTWREAALLSHGTAEQIYLLLRVAMAQRLTRRGEVCPILLDDPTVQFDRTRKRAMLETLHAVSATHQVVLLTQEDDVLDWARTHLGGPRDTVIRLDGDSAGA